MQNKPIIVTPKFAMKYLAQKLKIPYSKKIDTGYIIYCESERLKVK